MTGKRTGWAPPPSQPDKVLEVALRVFDEVGYSAATIEQIRVDADVSVGSIYHHFGSKEGIAGALYLESLWHFQRGLMQVLLRNRGAEEGVRAAVGHQLRWVDENRRRARFLMRRRETEVVRVTSVDAKTLNRELFTAIEEWYRPRVEAGELRELPPQVFYAVWFGPAQEYTRQAIEGRDQPKLLAAETALADAAWAALRSSR